MQLNQYSVHIIGGHEEAEGYVVLTHATQYRIQLGNHRGTRCNALIEVDGKPVGTWRLQPWQTIIVEHPAHDHGHFTFYCRKSIEGHLANLSAVARDALGLVRVTCTPEQPPPPIPPPMPNVPYPIPRPFDIDIMRDFTYRNTGDRPMRVGPQYRSYSPGGTGLSGHSVQQYGQAAEMALDPTQQTVLVLRLVAEQPEPDVTSVRPLTPISSPVPPAVGYY